MGRLVGLRRKGRLVGRARTVVLHPKIVDAVDGNGTVERVVDGVATHV